MKDPAFLFYSQDFLVGTLAMPFEERGKYITLMCYQHQTGRMSEETIRLLVGLFSDTLRLKFKQDEKGLFFNERLEQEIEKRDNFIQSRRNNGVMGGRPKKENKPNGYPTDNLIENENVIVNIKEIKEKFEIFRKQYTGTKGGFDPEFKNFQKKCKNEDVELLLPALIKEKQHKQKSIELGVFCPEWKNLSTWINQKCWLQELPELKPKTNGHTQEIKSNVAITNFRH